MKVLVRSSDINIKLWIPNSLVLSGFIRKRIVSQIYQSADGKIPFPPAVMNELLLHLKEIAKSYSGLNLVEVESSDGTEVLIQL